MTNLDSNPNKRRMILSILIIILIVSTTLIIVNLKEDQTLSVTDANGTEIKFEQAPETIVSTAPSITEILFALNLGDEIVGITTQADYPEEISGLKADGTFTEIGGFFTPNLEIIITLEAEVIFTISDIQSHIELTESLRALNRPVVVLYGGHSIENIYKNIVLISNIMDSGKDGNELVQTMKDQINLISDITDNEAISPSILYALWLDPISTTGNDTFVSEIINHSGGKNVFEDQSSWITIGFEDLIAKNPEVILISATYLPQTPEEYLLQFENDAIWNSISAVQNNKVYFLFDQAENILNRQSVRVVEAIQLLANILYPDLFDNQVPNTIGNDYLDYIGSIAGS
ncbi:MAG: Cobalamin-binding protein precursor [Candidatus Heimdallarchaeota archaeon LC_2]|nr:MAG: Cobalamin-binding protein precursor [Candidatus Heimdallarchaeota archaeon LC_2]